jgi:hypothetical protein
MARCPFPHLILTSPDVECSALPTVQGVGGTSHVGVPILGRFSDGLVPNPHLQGFGDST